MYMPIYMGVTSESAVAIHGELCKTYIFINRTISKADMF